MNSRVFTPWAEPSFIKQAAFVFQATTVGFHPRFSHKFYGLLFWTSSWLMCAFSFFRKTTQKLLFCACLFACKLFFTVENLAYFCYCGARYGKFLTQVSNQLFPTMPRWMVCTIINTMVLLIKRLTLRNWKRIGLCIFSRA